MASNDIHDILQNATRIIFLCPEKNNGIPTVFVIFENMNVAIALYEEVMRVNKEKVQYFGFKKSHSSLILSFILKDEERAHAKMLLDYDEQEFDAFVKAVPSNVQYLVLFGQESNGERQIAAPLSPSKDFLMFDKYLY